MNAAESNLLRATSSLLTDGEVPTHEVVEEACTQHDISATQVADDDELGGCVSTMNEPWARLVSSHKDGLQLDLEEIPADAHGRYNVHVIGRSANSTIFISDCPRVSNRHCVLYCKMNRADPANEHLEAWIEDTSANGTYINRTRIKKGVPRLLHKHDEVHLVNPELIRLPAAQAKPEDIARDIGANSFVFMSNLRSPVDSLLAPAQQQLLPPPVEKGAAPTGREGGRLIDGIQKVLSQRGSKRNDCNGNQRDESEIGNGNRGRPQLTRKGTVARLLDQDRDVRDFYEIKQLLGSGTSGQVFYAVSKETGQPWAVKIIDTRKYLGSSLTAGVEGGEQRVNPLELPEVTKEAELLRSLRHPHIIHLEDIFADSRGGSSSVYLIMELSVGGDLFDRILSKGRYPEEEAKKVMWQILQAIAYLHSKKVAHRDLKPENILLVRKSSDTDIKLTDFGVAKHMNQSGGLRTYCGTPQYYAPEILQRRNNEPRSGGSSSSRRNSSSANGRAVNEAAAMQSSTYTLAADMWSVGVIMYVLLAGAFPFSENSLSEQISRADFSFRAAVWRGVSTEAKQLIRHLLVVDPNQRWTAQQALQSKWCQQLRACAQSSAANKTQPAKRLRKSIEEVHSHPSKKARPDSVQKIAIENYFNRSSPAGCSEVNSRVTRSVSMRLSAAGADGQAADSSHESGPSAADDR